MTEKVNLEVGAEDIAIVISPENKIGDKYTVQFRIPNKISDELEVENADVPPYVLLGFQICQFVNNTDNLILINNYFQEQIDLAMEQGEDDGLTD